MAAVVTDDVHTLILLGIILFNGITVILSILTLRSAMKTGVNMNIVEKATNSMKDALVEATATASHAEGREEGRIEERAEALRIKETPRDTG